MTRFGRVQRLADRLTPAPTLERLAAEAAEAHGLEPAAVLEEARAVLARYGGRLPPVPELAADFGLDAGELQATVGGLLGDDGGAR